MRNTFSTLVIAIAIALLVPNNGAQAVAGSGSFLPTAAVMDTLPASDVESPTAAPRLPVPPRSLGWILAAGFLGVVALRRLRND